MSVDSETLIRKGWTPNLWGDSFDRIDGPWRVIITESCEDDWVIELVFDGCLVAHRSRKSLQTAVECAELALEERGFENDNPF